MMEGGLGEGGKGGLYMVCRYAGSRYPSFPTNKLVTRSRNLHLTCAVTLATGLPFTSVLSHNIRDSHQKCGAHPAIVMS